METIRLPTGMSVISNMKKRAVASACRGPDTVPADADMSEAANVPASIGSPKSTVNVMRDELTGDDSAVEIDGVGSISNVPRIYSTTVK